MKSLLRNIDKRINKLLPQSTDITLYMNIDGVMTLKTFTQDEVKKLISEFIKAHN